METPQDSFRRKNNFMNGKTQNMATSAASDKNTDTDTLQKCWLAEGREPDSRTTVIGPEASAQKRVTPGHWHKEFSCACWCGWLQNDAILGIIEHYITVLKIK